MTADLLASETVRYAVIPCLAALFTILVKVLAARARGARTTREVLSFWIELMVAALLNVLTVAALVATAHFEQSDSVPTDVASYLADSAWLAAAIVVAVWVVATTASRPYDGRIREAWWGYLFPHLSAVAVLMATTVFVSRPLPS